MKPGLLGRIGRGAAVGLAAMALVGCVEPQPAERANLSTQGEGAERPEWTDVFTYHNDQGLMSARCIADIHFVPGSADLSGTGVARLERYAELLATSGGTIHYQPGISDEELIESRLETAKVFLANAIPNARGIEVVVGLDEGRGMTWDESKGGWGVAKQPEDRKDAYRLDKWTKKED